VRDVDDAGFHVRMPGEPGDVALEEYPSCSARREGLYDWTED